MNDVSMRVDVAETCDQFSLRALFGFVWAVSAILASAVQGGVIGIVACGVPLAVLGFGFISYGAIASFEDSESVPPGYLVVPSIGLTLCLLAFLLIGSRFDLSVVLFALFLAILAGVVFPAISPFGRRQLFPWWQQVTVWPLVCVLLSCAIVEHYGRPANGGTWMVLIGCAIWSILIPLKWVGIEQIVLSALPILYLFSFFNTNSQFGHRKSYDLRTTRVEIRFAGGDIKFRPEAPNAQLIESYLGPMEPHWSGGGRCDVPKINRYTMPAFSPNVLLHDYMGLLPDEAARRQVLSCLTDPDNHLRMHQALLLAVLKYRGYPPEYDRDSWWVKHQDIFVIEPDPQRARDMTYMWMQGFAAALYPSSGPALDAASSPRTPFEQADLFFRHAAKFQYLNLDGSPPSVQLSREEQFAKEFGAYHRVAWWPRVK